MENMEEKLLQRRQELANQATKQVEASPEAQRTLEELGAVEAEKMISETLKSYLAVIRRMEAGERVEEVEGLTPELEGTLREIHAINQELARLRREAKELKITRGELPSFADEDIVEALKSLGGEPESEFGGGKTLNASGRVETSGQQSEQTQEAKTPEFSAEERKTIAEVKQIVNKNIEDINRFISLAEDRSEDVAKLRFNKQIFIINEAVDRLPDSLKMDAISELTGKYKKYENIAPFIGLIPLERNIKNKLDDACRRLSRELSGFRIEEIKKPMALDSFRDIKELYDRAKLKTEKFAIEQAVHKVNKEIPPVWFQ